MSKKAKEFQKPSQKKLRRQMVKQLRKHPLNRPCSLVFEKQCDDAHFSHWFLSLMRNQDTLPYHHAGTCVIVFALNLPRKPNQDCL